MEQLPEKIAGTKDEVYSELFTQFKHLVEGEKDEVAVLGIFCSLVKMNFDYISWAGFYMMQGAELVVGTFQGKPPCIRIKIGKGVCGTAALKKETLIVPDVDAFPGHIRCDGDSRSEIVIPLLDKEKFYGVLDIDSRALNSFDETDKKYLEAMCGFIAQRILSPRS